MTAILLGAWRPVPLPAMATPAESGLPLSLAATIAAGDALTADWGGWANAPGTRVLAFIEATLVTADDPL